LNAHPSTAAATCRSSGLELKKTCTICRLISSDAEKLSTSPYLMGKINEKETGSDTKKASKKEMRETMLEEKVRQDISFRFFFFVVVNFFKS